MREVRALLARGDDLEGTVHEVVHRREGACSMAMPSGEQSSTITTASPELLRQGQTCTSPSPVGW